MAAPKQPADERNGPARIGELPPHQHHQAEAEEQEKEAGYRVLDPDDFVILREDVFAPEPELFMRMFVRMLVRVAMPFDGRHLVHADSLPFRNPGLSLVAGCDCMQKAQAAQPPAGRKMEV